MRISDWSSDVCSSDLRTLLIDEQLIAEARLARATDQARSTGEETLGVITTLLLGYEIGQPDEKREMLRLSISNLWVDRSEERRVGNECVSTWRSAWSPLYEKTNNISSSIFCVI